MVRMCTCARAHPAAPGVGSADHRPVLAVERYAVAVQHNDMDFIVPILFLCAASCLGEPLNEAFRRRSTYGVYADDFSEEYEPVAVAAFPLHQPVQVLRLVSPAPAGSNYAHHKRSVPRVQPQRDYRDQYLYAAPSEPEYAYSYEEDYDQPVYAPSSTQSKYTRHSSPASYEEYEAAAPAPVVVYARPNKNGGYTYRQKPRPAAKPQEPVIIRLHKYKIVRD